MLQVSGLSISFGGNYLFEGITFVVNPGDRIGLVGRNGSGKSTLLRIISGELKAESGSITMPKEYSIGYLPQQIEVDSRKPIFEEAEGALVELKKIEAEIEDLNDEISRREDYESKAYMDLLEHFNHLNDRLGYIGSSSIDAEIEKILLGLGFTREDFRKPMNEFSGGWQMRVEIAKLLLRKPDCILLDEPTNHLDIDSIRWIEMFMRSYHGAFILVSHDKRFLDNVTNRTIEISGGKLYDMPFTYTTFIEKKQEIKRRQISAFDNQQRKIAQTERFIERFRSKATLATRVQSRIKALEKIERIEIDEDDVKAMNIRFPIPPRPGRLIVEAKNLSKAFGSNLVLNKIDFDLERGEKVAFVGKNGEGKTTFSRILAGQLDYEGELNLGSNVYKSYFAQHQAQDLYDNYTVFEVIDKVATGDMRPQIRNLLGAFLFSGDDIYKKVKVLSGGEKSRLALAKLLLEPINFLILDEPTNHLDMIAKDVLKQALLEFKGALIVVSHDRDFLEGLTDKTIQFKNKKIIEYQGDIRYFLEKNRLDSLDTLNENRGSTSASTDKGKQSAKEERERRKHYERERSKLQRSIEQLETNIHDMETESAKFEQEFSKPNFYDDKEKALSLQQEYEALQLEIDEAMSAWSMLSSELEKINDDEKNELG